MVKQIDLGLSKFLKEECYTQKDIQKETRKIKKNIKLKMRNNGVIFAPPKFVFKNDDNDDDNDRMVQWERLDGPSYDTLKEDLYKHIRNCTFEKPDLFTNSISELSNPIFNNKTLSNSIFTRPFNMKWEEEHPPNPFKMRIDMGQQFTKHSNSYAVISNWDTYDFREDLEKIKRKLNYPPKFIFKQTKTLYNSEIL